MCQTSKLLCWFLSPPPPPSPPLLSMGSLNKVFFNGVGERALPRGPHLLPFYILLWTKRFALPGGPPGLNLCLGARDVLCAVSGFGLRFRPKICRPLADTLAAALVKNPLVPRVSQECPLYSSAKNAEECFKNY